MIDRWRAAVAFASVIAAGGIATTAQTPAFDLVIVNATIVDGTGAPSRRGDVAIRDGRIVRIGSLGAASALERLDAAGLVLAPGFIDVHTHADDLAEHPRAENFIRMGVTTVVAGNCGTSALNIEEALTAIRDAGPSVNFATLVGHNTVREAVMRTSSTDPSLDQLSRMRALVFKAMAEGAIGFSTGLQYVPGTYAKSNEIIELARVSANSGGIYATHMRNEGTALLDAIDESIRVAETLRMPLEISHLKVDSPSRWGTSAQALQRIDAARARGLSIQADAYAYTAAASTLSIRFPSWVLEGGAAKIAERLNDAETWARIKREMIDLLAARGLRDLSFATVATYARDPSLNGLSMRDVAAKIVGDASADAQLEAARRLMLGGGASMVYHLMSDDDVDRILRHPMVAVASDASLVERGAGMPHPRAYGNTVRVLGEYVRTRHVLTLEDAVRRMTSLPAAFMGFANRGVIKEGAVADLVLFDAVRVADTATFAAPHAFPLGLPYVIVNGQYAVKAGELTGERAGQVLQRQRPPARVPAPFRP